MPRYTPTHNVVPPEIFIDFESHYHELYDLVVHYRDALASDSILSILRSALDDVVERIEEALRLKTLVVRCRFFGRNRLHRKYKQLLYTLRAIQADLLECMYDYDGN
ncbi:uncharacterized protein EAF01_002926 [Botrytis porri]|uniref:Uncharacterized protein n=1 Tax=Botrytis porri TaxID=87229 RepID=A0A4Z1KFQ9_9HELO|nr:uncharacterized protein EAF01_002926 [Botrytis porri]KAF7911419.1 hypothetical protein EAF01_002926 [Botrytis porri]TGO83022.1 hypothetical protein BPOR_0717g00040 [Botrytis porri]